jgi:hypothetical protein
MQATHCPICHSELQVLDVAPCFDCGHRPNEIEECKRGEHNYNEFTVFGKFNIILCDFCDADFGSYYRSYFGFSGEGLVSHNDLKFVREIDPSETPKKDKYCIKCEHRLAFIEFRASAIEMHQKAGSSNSKKPPSSSGKC